MTLPEAIAEAVQLFRAKLPDNETIALLTAMGISRATAQEILEFLPLVYARELLRRSGCTGFSETYTRRRNDGTLSPQIPFSRKPVWRDCQRHLEADLADGSHGDDLVLIAARSPEFQSAHQMLDQGSEIESLIFAVPVLTYPDDGPIDEK
ncbi:MAG TPA: hypothetical protein VGK45_15775 [Thermoanaerobaculia bacterium]|jgi:hypothetical protein